MNAKSLLTTSCFASLVILSVGPLQAGEIVSYTWSSGVASVGLYFIAPPVSPNNDDVAGASPNTIDIFQKDYVGIGPVDIEYTVIDSGDATGSVTEYIFSEGIQNGTGSDWSDYHIQLGFGVGADFVPSPSGDGLDFDAPDYNSPFSFAPFTTVDVFEDDIDAYGGVITSPSFTFPFVFTIDVPDGITKFTLRQYPTTDFIPEPSTLLLACLGFVGTFAGRRRR
jgi:hypothetical protein